MPVVDDVVVRRARLERLRQAICSRPLLLVTLAPPLEVALRRVAGWAKHVARPWAHFDALMREHVAGVGLWVDTEHLDVEQTVDVILAEAWAHGAV